MCYVVLMLLFPLYLGWAYQDHWWVSPKFVSLVLSLVLLSKKLTFENLFIFICYVDQLLKCNQKSSFRSCWFWSSLDGVAGPPFDMSGNLYAHMSATGEALPVTFQNLRTTPSGIKVTWLKREIGKKKMTLIVATLFGL